jgi:hypothetical protein
MAGRHREVRDPERLRAGLEHDPTRGLPLQRTPESARTMSQRRGPTSPLPASVWRACMAKSASDC